MSSIVGIIIGLGVIAAAFKWRILMQLLLHAFLFGCAAAGIVSIIKGDPAHIYIAYMAGSVATSVIIVDEDLKW